MKIAIVFESVFPEYKGGIERWYMKLSRGLTEKGHSVVYLNASGINEFRDGIEFICLTKNPWAYKKGGIRSKRQAISYSSAVFNWLNKIVQYPIGSGPFAHCSFINVLLDCSFIIFVFLISLI